jgi:hypothetical protein
MGHVYAVEANRYQIAMVESQKSNKVVRNNQNNQRKSKMIGNGCGNFAQARSVIQSVCVHRPMLNIEVEVVRTVQSA